MSEHEELHERAEHEADDLERRNQKLGEDIQSTRQDWESKKSDESVPGARPEDAAQEDDRADEDGPPPEADAVTPGD
jgi:hypothetical protein